MLDTEAEPSYTIQNPFIDPPCRVPHADTSLLDIITNITSIYGCLRLSWRRSPLSLVQGVGRPPGKRSFQLRVIYDRPHCFLNCALLANKNNHSSLGKGPSNEGSVCHYLILCSNSATYGDTGGSFVNAAYAVRCLSMAECRLNHGFIIDLSLATAIEAMHLIQVSLGKLSQLNNRIKNISSTVFNFLASMAGTLTDIYTSRWTYFLWW